MYPCYRIARAESRLIRLKNRIKIVWCAKSKPGHDGPGHELDKQGEFAPDKGEGGEKEGSSLLLTLKEGGVKSALDSY